MVIANWSGSYPCLCYGGLGNTYGYMRHYFKGCKAKLDE